MKTETIYSKFYGRPYVRRWSLFTSKLLTIVHHRFYCPDLDPPHNHDAWTISVILWGFGRELQTDSRAIKFKKLTLFPGRIVIRGPDVYHRINKSIGGSLGSIFFIIKPSVKWGFSIRGTLKTAGEYAQSGLADKTFKDTTNATKK